MAVLTRGGMIHEQAYRHAVPVPGVWNCAGGHVGRPGNGQQSGPPHNVVALAEVGNSYGLWLLNLRNDKGR
jgi:hypothetical protein